MTTERMTPRRRGRISVPDFSGLACSIAWNQRGSWGGISGEGEGVFKGGTNVVGHHD